MILKNFCGPIKSPQRKTRKEKNWCWDRWKWKYLERDNLIVLDNVSRLADRSRSIVTFLTTCRKFRYSVLYLFHKTALSSLRWKGILSQTQMFCIFSLAMDLVLNNLMKFVFRSVSAKEKVSRQQLWLTYLVQTLARENWLFLFLPKQETPCVQCC